MTKINKCPFCGSECSTIWPWPGWYVTCNANNCYYQSGVSETEEEAIATHNSIMKAGDLTEAILLLEDLRQQLDIVSRLQLHSALSILKGERSNHE